MQPLASVNHLPRSDPNLTVPLHRDVVHEIGEAGGLLPLCCLTYSVKSVQCFPLPLRAGHSRLSPEFPLVTGLPSSASASDCPDLFGPFIGTVPVSDSSATCMSGLRPLAFPDRPVSIAS